MAEKYVELNTFVKLIGAATTGGESKRLIRSEVIKVNGTIETRNKCKLKAGDVVEFEGKTHTVEEDVCMMVKE